MDDDCLFCRIVAGQISSDEVLSTKLTYAFRDIEPAGPTHVLVVPRDHITNAEEIGPQHSEILSEMFSTARDVARKEGISDSGYRLVVNVGEDASNTVPHLHLHVIGGRKLGWPPG